MTLHFQDCIFETEKPIQKGTNRDISRQKRTITDKKRQKRTLDFCRILYLPHINQKQTIYEQHANDYGCKPHVGRLTVLPE